MKVLSGRAGSAVEILENTACLADEVVAIIQKCATTAIKRKGFFTLVLSGGKTPQKAYSRLAQIPLEWEKVRVFWADERAVAPESPMSNYGMVNRLLLSKISIPNKNIHRIRGELADHALAARKYAEEIRASLGPRPSFDLVILGVGKEGHTASLFPGINFATNAWVSPFWIPELKAYRISMTPRLLTSSRRIVFLVSGSEKADVVKQALSRGEAGMKLPVTVVARSSRKVMWLLDKRAAVKLENPTYGSP